MNFCKFLTRIPTKAYRHAIGLKFIFCSRQNGTFSVSVKFQNFSSADGYVLSKDIRRNLSKTISRCPTNSTPWGSSTAIAIYGYLLRIEDRQTYQCLASYSKIGKAIGRSVNTVRKYVTELEERSLIRAERTAIITQDKCPIRCVLMVSGHFRIWVRIWVSRNCK